MLVPVLCEELDVGLNFKYKQRRCTGSYRNRPIVELKWSTEEGTYSLEDSRLKDYIIDIGKIKDYKSPQNISWNDDPAKNHDAIEAVDSVDDRAEVEWRITSADNRNAIGNLKSEVNLSHPPEQRTARLVDTTV